MMTKNHSIDILGYIAIGFIGGSISHGFFSGTRSLIMASIGIVLFIIHEYLKEREASSKNYVHVVVFGLLYSITIGMMSGGLQHFLDSPTRSLRIVPIGYFLSYIIYSIHMKSKNLQKNIGTAALGALLLAGICFAAYKFIPANFYSGIDGHHGEHEAVGITGQTTGNMHPEMNHNNMMQHANVVSEEQFIRDMIPHHQEAVDTSKIIVAKSTNPTLITLAQNIIDAQTKEIAMMKTWLQSRYPTSTGQAHYTNMMPNLTVLSGVELDHQYLMGMIMHHMGAVQMAEGVLKLSPKIEVKEFANNVITAQSKEIQEMKEMLGKSMPMMDHSKMVH